MIDDYSNIPESVAEIRAYKEEDAALWTPRDALISTLRDIDSGKRKPFVIFIALGELVPKGNDIFGTQTNFYTAGPNAYSIQGVMTRAIHMFQEH